MTKLLKNVILRQSWFETPCTVSSFVHITGSFDKNGQCIVDDTHNILVLHPDHLISATVVADSFSCLRRAVLQDRVKATGEASAPMMYGHMLHELFQEALKANTWDNASLVKIMEEMLPRHYETMAEIGLSVNQVQEHIKSKFPEIRGWAEVFISSIPKVGHWQRLSDCIQLTTFSAMQSSRVEVARSSTCASKNCLMWKSTSGRPITA